MHACAALNASQVAAALREALPKALPEESLGTSTARPLLVLQLPPSMRVYGISDL